MHLRARRTYVLTSYMCLAPVCFNIRALYGRMRLMSVPRHFDHLDSCLMFSRSVGAVIGSSTPSLLAWRRKSICYYSITDLRNMAFISILDNFSLNHPHWMSHSESKCQAFLYKAARCPPQSRIRSLFSPLLPPLSHCGYLSSIRSTSNVGL